MQSKNVYTRIEYTSQIHVFTVYTSLMLPLKLALYTACLVVSAGLFLSSPVICNVNKTLDGREANTIIEKRVVPTCLGPIYMSVLQSIVVPMLNCVLYIIVIIGVNVYYLYSF